ncbi:MAG: hypothetical protein RIR32_1489 [Verrucomicrobiota bacterium]|jgi:hypothetical protein
MPLSHLLVLTALLISPLVGLQAAEAPAVVFDARAYGAVGDDATDNTAAFSRCLAAVVAAGGGRMTLPTGVFRGRIIVPPINRPAPSWVSIEIVGETEPTPVFGTIGDFPLQNHGTIVKCLADAGPGVISVPRAPSSLYGGFSAVFVVLRNLDVRTSDNPGIDGVDLRFAMQAKLENVFINTGVYNVQTSRPTHETKGLITPACNNAALTILRQVVVTGYHTGIVVNEHTDADNLVVGSNVRGLEFAQAHHASRLGRVGAYRNSCHVAVTGKHGFSIAQLNTEFPGKGQTDPRNAWQTLECDVDDPRDLATADINYWAVKGNVGAVPDFILRGGANIRARRIGSAK